MMAVTENNESTEFPFDPLVVDAPPSPTETGPAGLTDASDESVFDAMTVLIIKDPKYESGGNRKSVKLRDKEGSSFHIRTTEQAVRHEWFDRLVKRGDAFQARINDKGVEYETLDDKPGQPTIGITRGIGQLQSELDGVTLDLETLDHLIFPDHRYHLVNSGYPDLRRRVAKETNRTEEALKGAADLRQKFFGEGNVPVWMTNTSIVARIVRE